MLVSHQYVKVRRTKSPDLISPVHTVHFIIIIASIGHYLSLIIPKFSALWSDELVVDDVDQPEAYLFLECAVRDGDLLHFFVVADVVVHDLPSQLARFLELFHLKEEPVEVQTLFLLLDNLDSQDRRERVLESLRARIKLLERA